MFKKSWLYIILAIISILFAYFKNTPDKPLNTKPAKHTVNNVKTVNTGSGITGKVTKVTDGDTVVILPEGGGKSFTCRLYGIDTPEVSKKGKAGQPYSEEADKELESLILGQDVKVTLTGDKTYKREVCFIEKNGVDINLEMVRRGYAWAYRQYLDRPHSSDYINAEEAARSRRSGLWQQANPTPPWEFRHTK
ncbi:MAG: thermonuclease family protein [Thermodesulfovibrionia bacterium]|nr:thermonuclease family protein [Thermodesulfovibrionia bacterium]